MSDTIFGFPVVKTDDMSKGCDKDAVFITFGDMSAYIYWRCPLCGAWNPKTTERCGVCWKGINLGTKQAEPTEGHDGC